MKSPVSCALAVVVLTLLAACGGGPKTDPAVPTMPAVVVTAQPQDYLELVNAPTVDQAGDAYTATAKLKVVKALPAETYQISYKATIWTKEGRKDTETQTVDVEGARRVGSEFEITLKVPAEGPEGARTFEINGLQSKQ